MKTRHTILTLAATLLTAAAAMAQTHPAAWQMFPKNGYATQYVFAENVEKIEFSDTNYDTWVYAQKDINEKGEWVMNVSGYGDMSIAMTRIGVVPALWPDSLMEQFYLDGTITNLHEGRPDSTTVYNRAAFTVDDGSYRPVIFGFDAEGQLRSHYLGGTVTFSSQFTEELNQNLITQAYQDRHNCFGYASLMHIRDVMGEEMTIGNEGFTSGYDWFASWETNSNLGDGYVNTYITWLTLATSIENVTALINMIELRNQVTDVKEALASAYAQRAMLMLDAARMYEFLPNDAVSSVNEAGNDVMGLTFPTVTARQDSTAVRYNREVLAAYILNDLNRADDAISQTTASGNKLLASQAVVSGLKARLYMWTEDYAQALTWAAKAIQQSGATPLTRDQWLSTTQGFNDRSMPAWMWAFQFTADSPLVQSGIVNWTSWMAPEFTGGYSVFVPVCAGKAFYDRIHNTDFRKLSFKAPAGSVLAGQTPTLVDLGNYYDYTAVKFRPGQGNTDDYTVACAVDVPLMRVEEMYFIQMEAEAQLGNLVGAQTQLNTFMSQYRDSQYAFSATDKEALVEEIFLEKRIELWGEGLNFFDYKRLNHSVTRGYAGSNFPTAGQFNTNGRPAWMNLVFPAAAYSRVLMDWNNPDHSDCYTPANY